jgi:hypothetical protein
MEVLLGPPSPGEVLSRTEMTMKGYRGFWRLIDLCRQFRHEGWVPLQIGTACGRFRESFEVDGLRWKVNVFTRIPSARTAHVETVVRPDRATSGVGGSAYCRALLRKMQQLRHLHVLGPGGDGKIVFFKRIQSFGDIRSTWEQLRNVNFTLLGGLRIPNSRPVRRPLKSVSASRCERLLRDLIQACRRGIHQPTYCSVGRVRKETASGARWTICTDVFWHADPRFVDPPSTFWASVMIWPPSGIDERRLEKSGFYDDVSRRLGKLGVKGRWLWSPYGRFGDFNRHQLRWKDVAPLCRELQNWTIGESRRPQ